MLTLEEKINKIADETLGKDLRVIGGIPPWLQMYFDVLKNKTGKKIKDIFPNLKLICHGGVNFEPYRANLFDTIGSKIDTLETFPASEGFFAYQNNLEKNDLILQTNQERLAYCLLPNGKRIIRHHSTENDT